MEPSTNDILRDRGLALQAIACLDAAIWDVFGRALGLPLHRVWGSVGRRASRSASSAATTTCRSTRSRDVIAAVRRRRASPGIKFKVGGKTPGRGRGPRPGCPRGRRPGLRASWSTPTRATTARQAVEFGRLVADLDIRWFEEPCRWTNDRALDARRPLPDRHPGLRRPERDDPARDPRPDRRTARSTSPTSTPRGPAVRRSGARPPAWPPRSGSSSATTRSRRSPRTCWRACPTTPSSSASTRSATRSSGACPTCRRGSPAAGTRCPSARASGSSSTADYVERHTVGPAHDRPSVARLS